MAAQPLIHTLETVELDEVHPRINHVAVQGGRVIADWPGLTRKALLDGRDVRPTLDLRSVFKAILADHIRIDARALTARVFPNSQGAPPLHGLMRA